MDWTTRVRFSAGARDISPVHSVLIGSGINSASYELLSRALAAGREADYSPPPKAEVKNG
jgi:hypothetical protein